MPFFLVIAVIIGAGSLITASVVKLDMKDCLQPTSPGMGTTPPIAEEE
jgi:hypothetical protein